MNVYDHVTADAVEPNDQILFNHDYLTVERVVDETDTIMVYGVSEQTGDKVVYFIAPDAEVGLWTWS